MHKYNDGTIKKKSKREKIESMKYFNEMLIFSKADEKGIGEESEKLPYVIITVGISGSGKSTWRKQFLAKSDFELICPDNIRKYMTGNIGDQSKNNEVWESVFSELDRLISSKTNVVFDSTCTNIDTVKRILRRTKDVAIPIFKIFECNPDVAKCRVNADILSGIDRANVPSEIVDRQYVGFTKVKAFLNKSDYLIMAENND